ncbi:hypothetical protein HF521_004990 [Silurus meridionalis]|uniref:Beta/gamma crystallin 'Greek key' domain-containing protein n=1 Tax=Silurus meridionalis TaxID=175797 RepID=A0A8T0B0J1_SILME|nr:hypothetical protein HF521_004990 [Silurus meridionalis]
MAKSSSSTRKSLKHLFFSKSTADLQEFGEKKESKIHTLFKRKEKKKDKRVDSPDPAQAEEHDGGHWNAESIYATAPRSKKGLFSQSETDLHKPKRYATFSFTWKRKKKDKNLSQSFSTIDVASEARGHRKEPEDEDTIEPSFRGSESVDHDPESTNAGDLKLANTENMSIPYIDSSVSGSDGFRTPPESPSQSLPEMFQLIPLTSTKPSHTSSSNSLARTFEGHFTPIIHTSTSNVETSSINSSLITKHIPEQSSSADSWDHSLLLHQRDTGKKYPIRSPESTSHGDAAEIFEELNANLSLDNPEQCSTQLDEIIDSKKNPDVLHYKPEIGFYRDISDVIDDTLQDNERKNEENFVYDERKNEENVVYNERKNEENVVYIASSDCILSLSHEVPGEFVSLSSPEIEVDDSPQIIHPTTESFSFLLVENNSNPASADVPVGNLDTDSLPPLTTTSFMVSDHTPSTFNQLRSSNSSDLNHNTNISVLLSDPDHPKHEPEPQELTISTSLLHDTFNTPWSLESFSTPTDLSHRSFSEDWESEIFKGNNLEEDECDEGIYDLSTQELKRKSAVFEKEPQTTNSEPVCECVIRENDFDTFNLVDKINDLADMKYSQADKITGENITRNLEEPRTFTTKNLLGSYSITTERKESVKENTFFVDPGFVRDEVQLSGESEAAPGEVERQILTEDLAIIKPDTPVLQVCVSQECVPAPPCSLHSEVSLGDRKTETHLYVEAGSGPSQESGSPTLPQWDESAGGGANADIGRLHVDRDDINTQETETRSLTCYPAPRLESAVTPRLPEPSDTFQQIQNSAHREEQDIVENPAFQSGDAADSNRDTCGENKSQGGIVVYIREFCEEEDNPQESTSRRTLSNHLPAARHTSFGRFPHAFFPLSTVIEESDTEIPLELCPESDTDMSMSHVGVMSTTFTLRPKVSQEGREDGKKVRKVSLVNNSSIRSSSVLHESVVKELENGVKSDTVDNETRLETLDEWKPRPYDYRICEGESRSSVTASSESEVSGSTHLYTSYSSSSEYEPSVRSSSFSSSSSSSSSTLTFSSERDWETLPSAVSLETAGSHSNTTWWNARSEVQVSSESQTDGRSWEELPEPAGENEMKKSEGIANTDSHYSETDGFFSGVFKATRVELSPTEADPETSALSSPHEMDSLVDTLKSMAPPVRHRSLRSNTSLPFSSLPPIVEDATSLVPFGNSEISSPTSPTPAEPFSSLPPDIGLNWSTSKDMRSPLTLMTMLKEQQGQDLQPRSLIIAPRASALSSIIMRKSSLPNLNLDEPGSQVNGVLGSSRLDHSLLFSSYRSEQNEENGKPAGHRSLFRAASLPEVSSGHDYHSKISIAPDSLRSTGSSLELSFLTPPSSLPGLTETSRISRSSLVIHSPTSESPTSNTTPLHLGSLSPESQVKPPSLQRTLSLGATSVRSPVHDGVFGFTQVSGPDRSLMAKYKAFPDAYLTKEKEHGKLNPRPGKMFIYSRPGLRGQRIEVKGDVVDATEWEFSETISIRVVRGGWVLYEKPEFKGEKIALDEGDVELTIPFRAPQDEPRVEQNGEQEDEKPGHVEQRRFVIGSLRRAVRDYSVPEICLFPEQNAEGKKVVFRDTSDDARIYGFPIKANSIIINAGLWLVFAEPFFQGVPRVLEVGGFPNPAAWGVTYPYVGSLHPLKIGEPSVEKPNEPKLVIYEKTYFTGKSREIYTNMRDFITRTDQQQTAFMYSVGSMKVIGAIWVGYEKEGFRGHQYLLEEGEYHDWRAWGGCDSELRSVRVIRTDLSYPMVELLEMSSEEVEEDHTLDVTEAIPDVELFGFSTSTRSIHVISGAWVAYSHVDYSGNQYVLEKGFYNNCADWGSDDNRICSIQPILPALADSQTFRSELLLYTEPNFQGTCQVHSESEEFLLERRTVQSCRVVGGSWVLYDANSFSGNQYILSEGDYANLTSMGCSSNCILKSVKPVPTVLTVPGISLFGLECFEGREVLVETEVSSMMEEGFNPHFLSVRVSRGCWVLCEHSNYRGRQFLLEPMEITNWPKFSSLTSIGSLYPIRQKRRIFQIRHKESGLYMSVQGGVDAMKTGRVVVSENVEGLSDLWFYQDGLIKNKVWVLLLSMLLLTYHHCTPLI